MMKENLIEEKSFAFAISIVGLYKWLKAEKKEYVLSKQLVRSGTSIGANIQEAQAAQTKKDFTAKMSVVSKEARETRYWLRLLDETGYFDKKNDNCKKILSEIESIIKVLTKIVKTCQNNS